MDNLKLFRERLSANTEPIEAVEGRQVGLLPAGSIVWSRRPLLLADQRRELRLDFLHARAPARSLSLTPPAPEASPGKVRRKFAKRFSRFFSVLSDREEGGERPRRVRQLTTGEAKAVFHRHA